MIGLLREWISDGALRRDGDGDGVYDQTAAVAIMDAWWERLIRAVYDPVIGDAARFPPGFDNAPSSGGSAYQDGWYGNLWTDLSMALGDEVRTPTSRIYCGGSTQAGGSLASCAERVLASLVAAGDALAGDQGADPAGVVGRRRGRADQVPARRGAVDALGEPADDTADRDVRRQDTRMRACQRIPASRRATPRTRPACVAAPRDDGSGHRGRPALRAAGVRSSDSPRSTRASAGARARLAPGYYVVSFRTRARDGSTDVRRVAVRRGRRRFRKAPAMERRRACGLVQAFGLSRPSFSRAVVISVRLASAQRGALVVRRAGGS